MKNDAKYPEPASLLEVRQWKRKTSDEIRELGFKSFRSKCEAEFKSFWAQVAQNRKPKHRAA